MKITGSMNYVKFDLENGYVVKAEGEMLVGKKFVVYRDTMKFWEPPHEHEELLEEQIENGCSKEDSMLASNIVLLHMLDLMCGRKRRMLICFGRWF